MEATIAFGKVTKYYGASRALDALSLNVLPGEIYGFIGPNGAGKSTTIRLMLGFLHSQEGTVKVLGMDPSKDDVAIKRKTGYVSSEAFLYPDMKVRDLFRFVEGFHGISVPDRVRQLVDTLDIDPQKQFAALSFGNRKKVAIACALLHSPQLIILDEPSNGLDPVIRGRLYELLQAEQRAGATIFFSSHVLAEVQRVCSRIGLIKQGRLIRESAASAFTNVGYRKVRVETSAEFAWDRLPGVAGIDRQGATTQFMYSGHCDELIRALASISIDSIQIEEPDLEAVFMHYFNENPQ